MTRCRNYFSQLLNVLGSKDVMQAEKHTAEPLVPELSVFEVELTIEQLKSRKSPGIDEIQAVLIKAGGRTIFCAIHKLIISIWNKKKLPEEWKDSIILLIHKKGDKTDCNTYRGISLLSTTLSRPRLACIWLLTGSPVCWLTVENFTQQHTSAPRSSSMICCLYGSGGGKGGVLVYTILDIGSKWTL